jgi:hypothetical protein
MAIQLGDVIVVHFTDCKVSLDEETLFRIHDELLTLADESGESGNLSVVGPATLEADT